MVVPLEAYSCSRVRSNCHERQFQSQVLDFFVSAYDSVSIIHYPSNLRDLSIDTLDPSKIPLSFHLDCTSRLMNNPELQISDADAHECQVLQKEELDVLEASDLIFSRKRIPHVSEIV
jgi:hypothetical protein